MKMNFIYQEYQKVQSFLKDNVQILVVMCLTTFSLVMQWYRPVVPITALNQLFYFVLLPVLFIRFVLKDNPLDYGFRIGHYRVWIYYVMITIIISFPILIFSSRFSSVHQYYAGKFDYYEFITSTIPILFAWEYLLRGFMLFGLKKRFGQASIVIQMIPFVLLHLGKPEVETLSCIVTGLWFGWIAYRGKSFWPAFIIHVFINFTVKYFTGF